MRVLTGGGIWHDLDLTVAVLDGLMKYKNAVACGGSDSPKAGATYPSEEDKKRNIVAATGTGAKRNPVTFIVEAADDIAYIAGDVEDALKCDWVPWRDVQDCLVNYMVGYTDHWDPVYGEGWKPVMQDCRERRNYDSIKSAIIKGLIHHVVNVLVDVLGRRSTPELDAWPDVLATSLSNRSRYEDGKNVMNLVFYRTEQHGVDAEKNGALRAAHENQSYLKLKKGVYANGILKHAMIEESECQARIVVSELWSVFSHIAEAPGEPYSLYLMRFLPPTVQRLLEKETDKDNRHLYIADYIAGMTDRFALQMLDRLKIRDGMLRRRA